MRSFASVVLLSLGLVIGLAACDSSTDPRFEPPQDCGPPGSLQVDTLAKGTSPSIVRSSSRIVLDYVGTLTATRDTFDARRTQLNLSTTIAGFRQGLTGAVVGDSLRLIIPPNLGYGGRDQFDNLGVVTIPACSEIQFNLRVLDIVG